MAVASNLGFPRIGAHRELKKALESFWSQQIEESELLKTAQTLKTKHWLIQKEMGIGHIPSADFSLYDHVLDMICTVGAIPSRYRREDQKSGKRVDLKTYFTMARGEKNGLSPMEMTKWFDTNYHYIVPEIEDGQTFQLESTSQVEDFLAAKELGIHTRPVLLGPVSFLLLAKAKAPGLKPLSFLPKLLPVYCELLRKLAAAGADWVQLDEPCLVLDLDPEQVRAFETAYREFGAAVPSLKILLATYFGSATDTPETLSALLKLPVAGIHLDLVRAPEQLDQLLAAGPTASSLKMVSLGLVDGRNVWRADLTKALKTVEKAVQVIGSDRIMIAPSCSLLFSPVDLDLEVRLDEDLRSWMAFAKQKVKEVVLLTRAVNEGISSVQADFESNRKAIEHRARSPRIHRPEVKARTQAITGSMLDRKNPHSKRKVLQQKALGLPAFPTTTIGSFAQTPEVRQMRAAFRSKKLGVTEYDAFLRAEISAAIRFQEEIEIDVLVHGEFERNDMVEYFGEQLQGFVSTQNGWVQSYGSRCVKPPIIFGDVVRPEPMTVEWWKFAQSLTQRPVKGMLTGPVTILQWSFVRNDQPRSETCRQIALAIRDEVVDLETAGANIIQIDEPAIREGLPLRHGDWEAYLKWAVDSFRLSAAGVHDETQIHTHMCYSEFNDMIEAIGAMDADVISIETSRSQMELLGAFAAYRYPNDIGPGVYDIHSPRIPTEEEMIHLLEKAMKVISPELLWINPDCGLKTRRWEEIKPALAAMTAAAKTLRSRLGQTATSSRMTAMASKTI